LAATVSLRIRDEGGPALRGQFLNVPVVTADTSSSSYKTYGSLSNYILTTDLMKAFLACYVPDPTLHTHPYFSPIHATDLSHLPPALVQVARVDVLRDEGVKLAEGLKKAGVKVKLTEYDDCHGFFSKSYMSEESLVAEKEFKEWLSEVLEGSVENN